MPKDRALYIMVFLRTFWMSFVVTLWCLLLGYPVAWMLASLPVRYSNLLMILVLLPFWTSLLVRTASWIIVLKKEGIINTNEIKMPSIKFQLNILIIQQCNINLT